VTTVTLYVNLAELLGTRIEQGFYRPGDRLPSVRALSVEHGVSLSTVQQIAGGQRPGDAQAQVRLFCSGEP
jgi:DNA-binding transcriptional MocR family regulator